jgi:AcrR family transcriptional regulator
MPKKVDKEERKELNMNSALAVFAREGYREANLSLIAEESGISRPTVYQYFSDKNDIYYYAVKLVTGKMFKLYSAIAWAPGEDTELDRIHKIFSDVLDYASSHDATVSNLMEFMLSEKKRGVDSSKVIEGRTAKLIILIKRLLRQGIDNGNIKKCDVESISNNLFYLIESCCFQVAVFRTFDRNAALSLINSYLDFLRP